MNIAVTSAGANTVLPIDYIEANAIRYVASYVVRAVKKKCMRSAHPLKEQIVLCLCDMEEDIGKIISSCNIILLDVFILFLTILTGSEEIDHESEDWTEVNLFTLVIQCTHCLLQWRWKQGAFSNSME